MAKIIDAIIQLKDSFTPTLHRVEGALTEHEKVQQRAAKSIQATGSSVMGVGLNISALVAPLAAAATEGLKLNSQFSAGMSKIATLLGNDIQAANQLKQGLRDLSDETGVSVTDLTAAEYQAISAGVDAAHVTEFMGTATKLAQAGFADASVTIDALTSVLNAYGMSADNAAHIADEFILTQNLGKTTVAEMAQTIGGVIPVASAAGVSTEELMASVAALTKNGMKTPDAMTALKGAITSIINPSSQAYEAASKLGVELSGAHLKEVGLTGVLKEVQEATGGDIDAMAGLFSNVRALNAMLSLTGPAAGTYQQALAEMQSANGLTEETFQQLLKNDPTRATALAMNQLKNASMDLGQGLAPILLQASTRTKQLAAALKGLSPEQWKMITGFVQAGIVAGFGLTAIGKLIKMYGSFRGELAKAGAYIVKHRQQIKSIATAGGRLPAVLSGIGKNIIGTFSAIAHPIATLRAGLARLGVGFMNVFLRAAAAYERIGGFSSVIRGAASRIVGVFRVIGTGILHPIASFRQLFTAIRTGFTVIRLLFAANPIGLALLALTVIIGFVITHWQAFSQAFTVTFEKVRAVVGQVVENIKSRFTGLVSHFQEAAARIAALWERVTGSSSESGAIISAIANTVASVFTIVGIVISTAIETAFNIVASVLDAFITVAEGVINFVVGVFTGDWELAWDGVKKIFTGIFDGIKGVFDSFCDGVMSMLDRIIGKSGEAKDAANDAQEADATAHKWVGSTFFPGGMTFINEKGPELVTLPTGTQITPHDESLKKRYSDGMEAGLQIAAQQTQASTINIGSLANTMIVRKESDINAVADRLFFRLKAAAINRM